MIGLRRDLVQIDTSPEGSDRELRLAKESANEANFPPGRHARGRGGRRELTERPFLLPFVDKARVFVEPLFGSSGLGSF